MQKLFQHQMITSVLRPHDFPYVPTLPFLYLTSLTEYSNVNVNHNLLKGKTVYNNLK